MLICIFGLILVILAGTTNELWGGQVKNEAKFDFQVKFDLEGQSQSSPKTIGTLTKVLCIFVPIFFDSSLNEWWVIVRRSPWLIHTHTDTRTHGYTDTQTQAMTIPERQNWPRVKTTNPHHWFQCLCDTVYNVIHLSDVFLSPYLLFRILLGTMVITPGSCNVVPFSNIFFLHLACMIFTTLTPLFVIMVGTNKQNSLQTKVIIRSRFVIIPHFVCLLEPNLVAEIMWCAHDLLVLGWWYHQWNTQRKVD